MQTFERSESGLLSSTDLKIFKYRLLYGFMIVVMVIMSLGCIFPILWVILSAFKDLDEFLRVPPTLFPRSFHPEKIMQVWDVVSFGKYYVNSIILIIGDLFMALLLNGVAGYVLSRIKPKGSKLVFILIFWSMLIPRSANMISLYMSFVDVPLFHINLTNSYIPLWLMAGANAFYVLLFKNYFTNIPMSYIEAARIDGCTNISIFAKIILPMSRPIVAVVAIFCIQASWGEFFWPYLVISDVEKFPVAVILYRLQESNLSADMYMMVMLFAIVPVLIIFSIFSRYIMDGANMSGLKE